MCFFGEIPKVQEKKVQKSSGNVYKYQFGLDIQTIWMSPDSEFCV